MRRPGAQGDQQALQQQKPPEARERAIELLKGEYAGIGPTQSAEYLKDDYGISLSPETVRSWMINENAWEPKQGKARPRRRRASRSLTGELAYMDTSEHPWFGEDHPKSHLTAMIDDASQALHAKFYGADSTETNMDRLLGYIDRHGLPRALYTDRASHFVINPPRKKAAGEGADAAEPPAPTQIGRALAECGIQHIKARSPQAKGRVERAFRTLQDRLFHRLRIEGIVDIADANEFLEKKFLPKWNEHLGRVPADSFDAHRPTDGLNLKAIFSTQVERTVGNDYVVKVLRRRFQIEAGSVKAGLKRSKVTVETRLDGEVRIRYKGEYLHMHEIFHK
jgi:hypothetical protein